MSSLMSSMATFLSMESCSLPPRSQRTPAEGAEVPSAGMAACPSFCFQTTHAYPLHSFLEQGHDLKRLHVDQPLVGELQCRDDGKRQE